ncbi:MAG: hypothetical protein K2I63_00905 [Helicobacter sp.]|nr:hypothetical protein [Helicobacter sp.]
MKFPLRKIIFCFYFLGMFVKADSFVEVFLSQPVKQPTASNKTLHLDQTDESLLQNIQKYPRNVMYLVDGKTEKIIATIHWPLTRQTINIPKYKAPQKAPSSTQKTPSSNNSKIKSRTSTTRIIER